MYKIAIPIGIGIILIYFGIYPSLSTILSTDKKKRTNEDKYEIYRHIINTLAFWIPATITFLIIFLKVDSFKKLPLLGVPISLIPALFVGMIGSVIGNCINIDKAEVLDIPKDSPAIKEETFKKKVGIASIITSGILAGKHTKKAIKDITDVDSWDKMK